MTYNIPGVFTSVIDRSYIQPMIVEGRSVLIAGFSKYGEDKFYNFADAETMEFVLGQMDIKKYGKGLMYSLGALTKTRNLIFKRLMPDDATFANLEFKTDRSAETIAGLTDPGVLRALIDKEEAIGKLPVEPKELEVVSAQNQKSVYFPHNPDSLVVYLEGNELNSNEYKTFNGKEVVFTQAVDIANKTLNFYTVMVNLPPEDEDKIKFIKQEIVNHVPGTSSILVSEGYDPTYCWLTVNGIELTNADYALGDGDTDKTISFRNFTLDVDDVVIVHSLKDELEGKEKTKFRIDEVIVTKKTNTIKIPGGYNPDYTNVSVNGIVKGGRSYRADDGETITFSDTLIPSDVVRLHTIESGDFTRMYGALIAKGAGEGYNDLYVQFRPAYDVEKVHSDEEGDIRYKFNFLKATVFEQTKHGQKRVSDEFVVSLIDTDPNSEMPIVSTITGEALFINDKFKASNEFLEFYLNEDFLPEFYTDLSIDDLTTDSLGNRGANRFILNNHTTDPITGAPIVKNAAEIVINAQGEFERKSTVQPGKDVIYTHFINPYNGQADMVGIRMQDGKITIALEGGVSGVIDQLYIDGVDAFYEGYLVEVGPFYKYDPDGIYGEHTQYIIEPKPHEMNHRWRLYQLLIGGSQTIWEMKSGYNGLNIIRDNRINLGYKRGNIFQQDAKQLMIEFFKQNDIIHEVLYPELDFDYIPDWTEDIDIMNEMVQLADEIGFTMPILALPRKTSVEADYKMRIEDVFYSSFNTALYSGQNNDNHYEETLGTRISVSPSYYAMINHLNIDEQISITEPMANIVKGQLPIAGPSLSYIAKSPDIEKLRGVQLNTIIKEIDGIYFIDQLTAYKAASKLSRINVVKVIHRMRKDLPKLLKDLLQRKALESIILSSKTRTEQYMSRWLVTDNNTIDGIFTEIEVNPMFVEEELKLVVSVAVKPIGTIEKIEVPITVY